MKKYAFILALVFIFTFTIFAPAVAAPLFPDIGEHWAREAVANLAAKGLLEGYPDGTFKGDRAATRWEMAMVVARMLAKMEQEHATFASKADLEELQKLVNSLKDELAALGVRVGELEDKVGSIDKRVTDLERIRFSGCLDSIYVANSFVYKDGYLFGDMLTGAYWDLLSGRPFMLGTGLTSKGIIDVSAKVSDDFSAGVKLAAYVSVGDELLDMFYGVSAPYLNNFFTQRYATSFHSNSNNTPWTRVNLDSFFLKHNPSGTKLTVGTYDTMICPLLYVGQLNPNVNGPKYNQSFGFQVTGNVHLFSDADYEVFYSKLPDGGSDYPRGQSDTQLDDGPSYYNSWTAGLDLKWKFEKGAFKINILRAVNDYVNATPEYNFAIYDNYYPLFATWNAFLDWTNPAEYVSPNITDYKKAPLYWVSGQYFLAGPQAETIYGGRFDYEFSSIKAAVEFASSRYKPNMNSSYAKTGTAFNIALKTSLVGGALDLGLDYLAVDPYYDPMILQYPAFTDTLQQQWNNGFNAYMWRFPDFSYFANLYQLHDSAKYPNNRNGIRFNAAYKFAGEDGKITLDLGFLTQNKSSVYTLAHTTGSTAYTGYEPGYIEPVFSPLSYAGSGASYRVDEDTKGKVNNFGLGVCYKFPNSRLSADLGYLQYAFKRESAYGGVVDAEDVYFNYVDLKYTKGKIGLAYPLNDKWTLKGGYEFAALKGHHAGFAHTYLLGYPYLMYRTIDQNNMKSDNLDFTESIPYLGFDYALNSNASWGLMIRFPNFDDKVSSTIRYPGQGSEFDWTGTQLFTEVKIRY